MKEKIKYEYITDLRKGYKLNINNLTEKILNIKKNLELNIKVLRETQYTKYHSLDIETNSN